MNRIIELAQHCYTMMQDNSLSDNDKEDYRNMLRETKSYLDNLVMIRDDYTTQSASSEEPKQVVKQASKLKNKPVEIVPDKNVVQRVVKQKIKRTKKRKSPTVKVTK